MLKQVPSKFHDMELDHRQAFIALLQEGSSVTKVSPVGQSRGKKVLVKNREIKGTASS